MDANLRATLVALVAGLSFSSHQMALRHGMRTSNPHTATVVGVLFQALILGAATLLVEPLRGHAPLGLFWFALAGVVNPGLARATFVLGIHYLGVSRAAAVGGIHPLVAMLGATLFLGEQPAAGVWMGAALVVAGLFFLGRPESPRAHWRPRNLLWPLANATLFGLAAVLRKAGLELVPHPLLGAGLSSLVGIPVMLALEPLLPARGPIVWRGLHIRYYALAGLFSSLGVTLVFLSFRMGEVSVVAPILALSPLMTVALACLFLRRVEAVTRRVVVGASLSVAGAILVTFYRNP